MLLFSRAQLSPVDTHAMSSRQLTAEQEACEKEMGIQNVKRGGELVALSSTAASLSYISHLRRTACSCKAKVGTTGVKQAPKTPSPPLVSPVYQGALLILNPRLASMPAGVVWLTIVKHTALFAWFYMPTDSRRHGHNACNLCLGIFIYFQVNFRFITKFKEAPIHFLIHVPFMSYIK
jgi:hypothetical protein